MTNILSNLILLFLFFSCSFTEKSPDASNSKVLTPLSYIPDLDNELNEISGMLYYDELYWGFNDSGGKNQLYGYTKEGKIVKEVEIEDAKNRDWESIAQDSSHIYIGDFGNNMGGRENLRIYKIKKKDINKKDKQEVKSKKISFSYADQERFGFFDKTTPFDCEAMIELKGSLYIFSKNWQDRTTTVYRIPTKKGEYEVHPVDTFNVKGLITGADISSDNTHLALVGYENYKSFIWLFSDFPEDNFFDGKKQRFKLKGLNNTQTEGICFYGNDTLLVSCERTHAFKQQVFLFDLTKTTNGTHQN